MVPPFNLCRRRSISKCYLRSMVGYQQWTWKQQLFKKFFSALYPYQKFTENNISVILSCLSFTIVYFSPLCNLQRKDIQLTEKWHFDGKTHWENWQLNGENCFKVCDYLMGSLCVSCLFCFVLFFCIIEHLVYITLDMAGVGKRKVMQKGVFAYKGDEKCVSYKNLFQRFNINACKMSLN